MRHRYLFGALLVGTQVFSLVGCASSDEEGTRVVPEGIRGVWVTEDPEFEGQNLELMEEAILFYIEKQDFDPYAVRAVRAIPDEEGTLYEIDHASWEGGEITLSLRVYEGDSTLVFKNQPFRVWRKVRPAR